MAYTTSNFLDAVSRKGFIPTGQATFVNADILAIGDEVLEEYVMPAIQAAREEYYITSKTYPLVANTSAYLTPPRSIAATIRDVQIINDTTGSVKGLPRSSLDRQYMFSPTGTTPELFYLLGDKIIVSPTPTSTQNSLKVYYPLRCGRLIEVTDAAVISAINTTTKVVSVTTIPSTWVTGDSFDIVSASGSQLYLSIDQESSLISGTDITFSELPDNLTVGDYISPAGTSPLIQLPNEFRSVLATLTAASMLMSMNQPSGESLLNKGMKDLSNAQKMLSPRVVGQVELILPSWD